MDYKSIGYGISIFIVFILVLYYVLWFFKKPIRWKLIPQEEHHQMCALIAGFCTLFFQFMFWATENPYRAEGSSIANAVVMCVIFMVMLVPRLYDWGTRVRAGIQGE